MLGKGRRMGGFADENRRFLQVVTIKGLGRASLSLTEGTWMLRSWPEADAVSLLCCRIQGVQARLRLNGGEKIFFAEARFQTCEGR